MEMGIIDKYKVALNLVHGELAKHNITLPTPLSVNTSSPSNPSSPRQFGRVQYLPTPKAADIQILRLQPVEQSAKSSDDARSQIKESKSEHVAEKEAAVGKAASREG